MCCCVEEGIKFIGFYLEYLDMFGDKVKVCVMVIKVDLLVIFGIDGLIKLYELVKEFVEKVGFLLMIKVISGGGGKGMRIVCEESELEDVFYRVKLEVEKLFGNSEVYIERYIDNLKYIEV